VREAAGSTAGVKGSLAGSRAAGLVSRLLN
jgi:hypothetical protein